MKKYNMNKVGIICDLNYIRHHLFMSYYYAVENLFNTPKVVNNIDDLRGIELLFVGDPHHKPHKNVLEGEDFVAYCNINDIKIVVWTNEKILDSYFPWNVDNLKFLERFSHLYHYVSDVDDCIKLGLKIHRQSLSLHFKNIIPTEISKKNKIVFIGAVNCPMNSYNDRKILLNEVQKIMEIDIIDSNVQKWEDYLRIIAGYRFVLSPLGNGNFFPMRFYEALAIKSIPLHQVKGNTLKWYDIERDFSDCIFFKEPLELKDKLNSFSLKKSHNMIWMEDGIKKLLIEDHLL